MFLSVISYWKNEIQAVTQPGRNAVLIYQQPMNKGGKTFIWVLKNSYIFSFYPLFSELLAFFFFNEYCHTCFNPPSKPGNMP